MARAFEVGQEYTFTIDGKTYTKTVTRVNGKSIYFGKVRVPYAEDEDGQYLFTDQGTVFAQEITTEADENKEEEVMFTQNEEVMAVTEEEILDTEDVLAELDAEFDEEETTVDGTAPEDVQGLVVGEEKEFLVVKAERKKITFWIETGRTPGEIYDMVHTKKGMFIRVLNVERLNAFLAGGPERGLIQTVRDICARVSAALKIDVKDLDYEFVAEMVKDAGVGCIVREREEAQPTPEATAPEEVEETTTEE